MSRTSWSRSVASLGIVLLLALALAGCGGAQTQATPAAAAEVAAEVAAETTEATAAETATEEATEKATEEVAATEAAPEAAAEASAGTALRFQIVPEGTEARFLIDEVLMGQDKTVVGVTSLVSGEITVDPVNPSGAQVGEIRVDASSLSTDDNRRNGRIRNDILRSGQAEYQYIVFTPTAISGMPDRVAEGEPFTFQVTGDLMRFEWKEYTVGLVGPNAMRSGRGYFKYKRPPGDNVDDSLAGEIGRNQDEVGDPWEAIKQRNVQPDLASIGGTGSGDIGGGDFDGDNKEEGKPEAPQPPPAP